MPLAMPKKTKIQQHGLIVRKIARGCGLHCFSVCKRLGKHDEESWLRKFTPRRPKSIWSKRNCELVEQLAAAGKVKPAGLKEVAAAKADGRWDKAYDSPSKMTVPADFLRELTKNKKAQLLFKTLNKANKHAIAWRLQTAAKPEIRHRRMKAIIAMLGKGEAFH
jgi:uncharacterized protein YdeI (YjbR/CyaY-like superfamily)